MPFGLGKNDDDASIQPLDNDDLNELKKIQEMLNPNEDVLVVARQLRVSMSRQQQLPKETLMFRSIYASKIVKLPRT
jgi:hypothetical protein